MLGSVVLSAGWVVGFGGLVQGGIGVWKGFKAWGVGRRALHIEIMTQP